MKSLSRVRLCDPIDCSPPGSSLHGILQARVLEWVAISFSRGSSWPRDRTQLSRIPGRRFNLWATKLYDSIYVKLWRRQNDRDRSKFSPSNWGLGEWYATKRQHEAVFRLMELFHIMTVVVDIHEYMNVSKKPWSKPPSTLSWTPTITSKLLSYLHIYPLTRANGSQSNTFKPKLNHVIPQLTGLKIKFSVLTMALKALHDLSPA